MPDDELFNLSWPNGRITRFDVEDNRKDAYLLDMPEHLKEVEKKKEMSEYRGYLMDNIERLWLYNNKSHFVTNVAAV